MSNVINEYFKSSHTTLFEFRGILFNATYSYDVLSETDKTITISIFGTFILSLSFSVECHKIKSVANYETCNSMKILSAPRCYEGQKIEKFKMVLIIKL